MENRTGARLPAEAFRIRKRVFDTLTREQMIPGGSTVFAGLSGGADSVCLLRMLAAYREMHPFSLTAVHIHHGIRGEEAEEDARFCEALARELQLPFLRADCDVPKEAAAGGISLEEAGRLARYRVFGELLAGEGGENARVALAHHMDDQAETVLMHLARGAGPEGIGGMRQRSGDLYRPLLGFRKAELTAFLRDRGFTWREDATNRVADNPRNALRLNAIPTLESCWPGFVAAAARYARSAQIESDFLAEQARSYLTRCGSLGAFGAWLELDPPPHPAILRRAIRAACPEELDFEQIEALQALCSQPRGKIDIGKRHYAERTGRRLYFVPKSLPEIAPIPLCLNGVTRLPGIGSVSARPGEAAPIRDDPFRQALDMAALEGAVLRTRRPGDRIRPLGGGDKLLSDHFIDRKVDRPLRDMTPLIAIGSRVLWAVGLGIAEEAKLTGGAAAILEYIPVTTNDDGGKHHGE